MKRIGCDEVIPRPLDAKRLAQLKNILRDRIAMQQELEVLQERLRMEMQQGQIVARSKPMREILQPLPQLAASEATVLITGETGTGKELIARAIHYLGPRAVHHHRLLRQWLACDWPGNVRELENKVREWLALGALEFDSAASEDEESGSLQLPSLAEVRQAVLAQAERIYLRQLLQQTEAASA